ncbi:MAG: hypothetical protein AAF770_00450 [Bacteroidota bacterium]
MNYTRLNKQFTYLFFTIAILFSSICPLLATDSKYRDLIDTLNKSDFSKERALKTIASLPKAAKAIGDLEKKVNNLNKLNNAYVKSMKELQTKIKQFEKNKNHVNNQLLDVKIIKNKNNQLEKDLKEAVENRDKQIKELQKLKQKQSEVKIKWEKIKDSQNVINELQEKIQSQKTSIGELQEKLETAKKAEDQLNKNLKNANQKLQEADERLADEQVKKEYQDRIKKLDLEVKKQKDVVTVQKKITEKKQQKIKLLEQQLAQSKEQLDREKIKDKSRSSTNANQDNPVQSKKIQDQKDQIDQMTKHYEKRKKQVMITGVVSFVLVIISHLVLAYMKSIRSYIKTMFKARQYE